MTDKTTTLRSEIQQRRPFRSAGHEAAVALLRTTDVLRRRLTAAVEPFGVTFQQYNVLRILRGVHPEPLPTLEIGERMVERTPGVTRLLDHLERKGYVRRRRCTEDRRRVHCWITDAGLELLGEMDDPVDAADEATVTGLSTAEVERLLALLQHVRAGGS